MHSVQRTGPATKVRADPARVWAGIEEFFAGRLAALEAAAGPATLAAGLFAAWQGADYIRTHDVAALRDALTIVNAAADQASQSLSRTAAR